jgi:hypothetical protein
VRFADGLSIFVRGAQEYKINCQFMKHHFIAASGMYFMQKVPGKGNELFIWLLLDGVGNFFISCYAEH